MHSVLPVLVALLPFGVTRIGGGHQEAAAGTPAPPSYPCAASATVVRFVHLENDEPNMTRMRAALEALGAEVAYGPRTSTGRPGHCFLALRAPAATSAKKLLKAVRKGGGKAEALECLVFEGASGNDSGLAGLGVTRRDLVIGMSGDIEWVDRVGAHTQIYGPPGKLDAEKIADIYAKLYAPYGGAQLGAVAVETFGWTLEVEPEARKVKSLLKAIEKLDSVDTARLDGARLTVVVSLREMESCSPAGDLSALPGEPLDRLDRGAPRAAFDTNALHALLLKAGLVGADSPGD